MKKIVWILSLAVVGLAFTAKRTLTGTYEYAGGIYNGKAEKPSADYTLQRLYDKATYKARMIAEGEDTLVYEAGNYSMDKDTVLETQTFSAQPSKTLNITIRYRYAMQHDTLVFNGVLPNGTTVQEYWRRVK